MPRWLDQLNALPSGYSRGRYRERTYGMRRTMFAGGRSQKFYAEALGGTDFVSLNVYHVAAGPRLQPCEMPAARVIHFLENVTLLEGENPDENE